MTNSLNEFLEHENSLWGRKIKVVRVLSDQNRIILNELKKTYPDAKDLSEAKLTLFILHKLEEFLKKRNPEYVRFCETNHYRRND